MKALRHHTRSTALGGHGCSRPHFTGGQSEARWGREAYPGPPGCLALNPHAGMVTSVSSLNPPNTHSPGVWRTSPEQVTQLCLPRLPGTEYRRKKWVFNTR